MALLSQYVKTQVSKLVMDHTKRIILDLSQAQCSWWFSINLFVSVLRRKISRTSSLGGYNSFLPRASHFNHGSLTV